MNTNTVLIVAMLGVLGYAIYTTVRPPVRYTASEYQAQPPVVCPGQPISWVSGIDMSAPRQPADMTTARDVWDEALNDSVIGAYHVRPFILPHTVGYTRTEVFSDTAGYVPGEYIFMESTGGRLTARDAYAVRFTVRPC